MICTTLAPTDAYGAPAIEPTETTVESVRLHGCLPYTDNNVDGPISVVLIHGLGSSSHIWYPALEVARELGVHAIALDLPGFGKASPETFTVPEASNQVAETLTVLGIQSAATILAHSVGGAVVLSLAGHSDIRPRRIVLVAGPPLVAEAATSRLRVPRGKRGVALVTALLGLGLPKRAVTAGINFAPRWVLDGVLRPFLRHPEKLSKERLRFTLTHTRPRQILRALREARNSSWLPEVPTPQCPVLSVLGSHDWLVSSEDVSALAAIPKLDHSCVIIGDASHLIPIEHPRLLLQTALG